MGKLKELREKRAAVFTEIDELYKTTDGREMTAEEKRGGTPCWPTTTCPTAESHRKNVSRRWNADRRSRRMSVSRKRAETEPNRRRPSIAVHSWSISSRERTGYQWRTASCSKAAPDYPDSPEACWFRQRWPAPSKRR